MHLDDVLAAQKRGEVRGITSVCSAHPVVIRQALETFKHPLIEATCNQVNQFGGYTGLTPSAFAGLVRQLAGEAGVPFQDVLLGGDHLGPYPWQGEPTAQAMAKARIMVADYAQAGFTKLHLDCSMRLNDDPAGALSPERAARRAAELAAAAEPHGNGELRYVIGTEVPQPGGAVGREDAMQVTEVEAVREMIETHRAGFLELGLRSAWDRVVAIVVQPGVEFGDDFVRAYASEAAASLSDFIGGRALVYEAHSTDYQRREALQRMVRDHFAILKVGPALTFAYREAIFALAMIEDECVAEADRSNIVRVLDDAMKAHPGYWASYYRGSEVEQAFRRRYSLSDRVRYYWALPEVQRAVETLMHNFGDEPLPYSLSSQFAGEGGLTAQQVIRQRIGKVLEDYFAACERHR